VWDPHTRFPSEISKPSRGLYKPVNSLDSDSVVLGSPEQIDPTGIKVREADFYEPFAEWLKNDLEEVSDATPLGGATMKSKWGTPDVAGVYKPLAANLIKFSLEIVSAEIKIDPQAPVVAFGQAAAYRLFSSKTYVAMPTSLTEEDQSRFESLCMLFGVGLAV
jgi:preprotein translocase subunit Sec61beta